VALIINQELIIPKSEQFDELKKKVKEVLKM
jgi:hypothetical protein